MALLPPTRTLQMHIARSPFANLPFPALFLAGSFGLAIPSLRSLLDLIPSFLLAVPKKKTSHSRKAMRSANKGLQDKNNIVHCPGCGSPKLAHHLCPTCYTSLSRRWKAQAKQEPAIPDL